MNEKLTYQFVDDAKLLQQYYRVRKIVQSLDYGSSYGEYSDYFDNISNILIVRNRHRCVGGVRLTVSVPCRRDDEMLPMENESFRLKYVLPELDLKNNIYSEISDFSLFREYRDRKIIEDMYKNCRKKARQHGARYIFIRANKAMAIRITANCRKFGMIKLLDNKEIKKHLHRDECLVLADIRREI